MAIFKALEFDGVNSLDYGIYITGEAVYNAPERAIEMVNIPGKNGALALDQGRFENIEVTYHAGCFADSQADFADKVMQFRNALASRYTYKRLTDEYHPDEYRLGLYKSGLEVDAVRYGTAGEFDIVFDCKPQRFLVDGDRAISPTEWSDVQTESGELVTIDSDGSLAVKSLEVSLEPIQDLHGYDKPWSGGNGKNLFKPLERTVSSSGITYSVDADGKVTLAGTATATTSFTLIPSGGGVTIPETGYYTASLYGATNAKLNGGGNSYTINLAAGAVPSAFAINVTSGTAYNESFYVQFEKGITATTYEPYSNICPISGRAEVVTWDDPKYGGTIEWDQLFSTTGIAGTFNGVTITTTDTAVKFKGTATANVYRTVYNANSHNGHVYYVTLTGANSNNVWLYNDSKGVVLFGNGHVVQRATADSQFYIRLASGGVYDETITAQIFDLTQIFGETKANEIYAMEQAQAGDGVAYFKSLFPKDYYEYNAGEETCVSAVNGEPYGKYTTALGRTVYGGTLDAVSGVLTVDRAMVDLGSLTWSAYGATASYDRYITTGIDSTVKEGTVGVCSHLLGSRTFAVGNIIIGSGSSKLTAFTTKGQYASASDFKTAMSGATFVYELATPQTYQLTPQQIDLLLGTNHLWSDGEITLTYGVHPYYNPTPFESKPLIKVTGTGTLGIGEYILTITGTASQTLYIDCETMEIYALEGTVPTGASSLVSINKNDFPVLEPGTNYISVGSGITAVTITPRWWRI